MKFIPLLLLTLFISNVFSQDILTTKTGEELKVKVLEINNDNIKYKKHENLEGPSYTMEKSSVFMIKYENGTKEVFTNVNGTKEEKNTFDFKANRKGGYLGVRTALGVHTSVRGNSTPDELGYKLNLEYANFFNSYIGFRTGIALDSYKSRFYYNQYYNQYYNLNQQYNNNNNYETGKVISIGMPIKLMVTTKGRLGYYFEGGPTFYWRSNLSTVRNYSPDLRMEFGMVHALRFDINKKLTVNAGLSYVVYSYDDFIGAQLGLMLKL